MSSSCVSLSPAPFSMSSVAPSTTASSPPPFTDSEFDDDIKLTRGRSSPEPNSESPISSEKPIPIEEEDFEGRFKRLTFLLEKSAAYANILKMQMDKQKMDHQKLPAATTKKPTRTRYRQPGTRGKKRLRIDDSDSSDDEGSSSKRVKTECRDESHPAGNEPAGPRLKQPALVTGAKLKDYQLEGVEWMISLDQNGISGILADEMGLGKTLQTIAFNAYLRERQNFRPFLIVCPLSVLHNWIEEFAKFAPAIPVCMYHGTPAERAELRRTVMRPPKDEPAKDTGVSSAPKQKTLRKSVRQKANAKGRDKHKETQTKGRRKSRRLSKLSESEEEDEDKSADTDPGSDLQDEEDKSTEEPQSIDSDGSRFPVVITTYEMIIKDRIHLSSYHFSYIVVDEGHRLKNLDCKLMQEIKKYHSAGRMILTGTPLHNNLAELWSLLNFILPDIFNDVDSFQEWFNLPTMQENLSSHSSQIIHSLHAILKPFLLRRLKVDVEVDLPPKKEYVLYAPLSVRQREVYDHVLGGGLREFLIGKGRGSPAEKEVEKIDVDKPRELRGHGRKKGRKSYADEDDDEYFDRLESGNNQERQEATDIAEMGREYHYKATTKQVNNMKLQNTVMQLRKVCSHPFLFDWPLDPDTQMPVLNDELVNTSGKMMVLDRLLVELFKRRHKVLLFSQFTTMLDIIQDWACEVKGWNICRIDGSTPPLERKEQMNLFQNGGDSPDAPILFLLSTRSGGLGINLVAADTVIFYDQDWNPQMDAQAQDRAHRIGQTKPVLIFRLVSAHTIETKIMQRATEKRKLEALVIAKGKFKMPASAEGRHRPETMAEMAASLLKLEGEKIQVVPNTEVGKASVLSDEDLEMLLDRRPEVFADRGQGWSSARGGSGRGTTGADAEGERKKTAFAVYEAPVDEGNAALANMLGEDVV